ncbi:MAG: Uncharacterized protein AWU57_5 [Marinobacter sp. T13-3]|nr:MAG: Uncharacterized protein AWU57_5 [Marinobacter sp. T13-3]
MQRNRLSRFSIIAGPLLLLANSPAFAGVDCSAIKDLRDQYADVSNKIAKTVYENTKTDTDDIDLEEQGCISNYGLDMDFGLPSMADLSGIMDQVCAAADNYINDQVSQFSAGITGPLGLNDVGVGISQTDGENGSINMDTHTNEIGLDTEGFINDAFNELPDVDSSYTDYNYDGQQTSAEDFEYGEQTTTNGGLH